jgi:hypothetical protein
VDNLLAYGAPVPLLDLARVRIHPVLVEFEDCPDVSSAHNLLMLAEELEGQK